MSVKQALTAVTLMRTSPGPLILAMTTWSTVHGLSLIYINNQMPESGMVTDKISRENIAKKVIDTLFEGLKNTGRDA